MSDLEYWIECIATTADDCEIKLTVEQIKQLAEGVQGGHENYSLAFYSPPASDRISEIEREYKAKLSEKDRQHEQYRSNAETAIKEALRQPRDANVSIGEYGEVTRYDGRITQIQ